MSINTIFPNDFRYWEMVDELVQQEPPEAGDPDLLGLLASVGIVHGKPFEPDARMRKILEDAVVVGNATARTVTFAPRPEEGFAYYPDSAWSSALFVGGYQFLDPPPEITADGPVAAPSDGARKLNSRTNFFYMATGITPAMCMRLTGIGSQYIFAMRDSEGKYFDGGRSYRLTLPPDIPESRFWSLLMYDRQTRSMLQTDQHLPRSGSQSGTVETNPDGSTDIYFGPTAPDGKDQQLAPDRPRQGLVDDPSALQPAPTILRQDLAAQRDRTDLTNETATPCGHRPHRSAQPHRRTADSAGATAPVARVGAHARDRVHRSQRRAGWQGVRLVLPAGDRRRRLRARAASVRRSSPPSRPGSACGETRSTTAREAFASSDDVRQATGLLGLVLTIFFATSFTTALQRVVPPRVAATTPRRSRRLLAWCRLAAGGAGLHGAPRRSARRPRQWARGRPLRHRVTGGDLGAVVVHLLVPPAGRRARAGARYRPGVITGIAIGRVRGVRHDLDARGGDEQRSPVRLLRCRPRVGDVVLRRRDLRPGRCVRRTGLRRGLRARSARSSVAASSDC